MKLIPKATTIEIAIQTAGLTLVFQYSMSTAKAAKIENRNVNFSSLEAKNRSSEAEGVRED